MKKSSHPIEIAISAVETRQDEITALTKTLAADDAKRAELENSCDLDDLSALAQIGILQTRTALVPRRLEDRENALGTAQDVLLAACHGYIASTLGPRIRELSSKTRAQAEAALKPHFPDAGVLARAIEGSASVLKITGLSFSASIRTVPRESVLDYAKSLLAIECNVSEFAAEEFPTAAAK